MGDVKYKDEDTWGYTYVSPFEGIQKGQVLQECRVFNDQKLNTAKCEEALTRLLYLVMQGEKLTIDEGGTVFFGVTKLFQSQDHSLRRLVYLAIKELAAAAEESVFIVTNCLMKDINNKEDMLRANATRVLCRITDGQSIQAIERFLNQEIVDKNPYVASAALTSGQYLLRDNKGEVLRRWVNEIAQAMEHPNKMVQYHALCLMYMIRQNDKLSVTKMIQQLVRSGQRTPLATVMLLRLVGKACGDVPVTPGQPRALFDFLEACLRHRSDMVVHEAARQIVALPEVNSIELQPVVNVMQLFLVQEKVTLRFSAMRLLNRIAATHPAALAPVNGDMEQLLQDSNRSIATLAITVLLRTGSESSIERLLKQIQTFLPELGDEFKTKVVDAIHQLCLKFPSKLYALLNFLGSTLREEGGFAFKKTIVNTYVSILSRIPESKEIALSHLCEFIEDCEHTSLSARVLYLLGELGPTMPYPGKYVRYIFNRIILENAMVRAAAVSALCSFAMTDTSPTLRRSVVVLLQQSLVDNDDEVRDRAAFYVKALGLDDVMSAVQNKVPVSETPMKPAVPYDLLFKLPCPVQNLEADLIRYVNSQVAGTAASPFDLNAVSKAALPGHSYKTAGSGGGKSAAGYGGGAAEDAMDADHSAYDDNTGAGDGTGGVASSADPAAKVCASAEIAALGFVNRPFKSCLPPIDLTEEDTEYEVRCVKHVYTEAVILEFSIVNTMNTVSLANVRVEVDIADVEGVAKVAYVSAPIVRYGTPESCFTVLFCEAPGEVFMNGAMTCAMKYVPMETDPNTGEFSADDDYEDEYAVDDLAITIGDLMAAPGELPSNFKNAWEQLGDEFEVQDDLALSDYKTVAEAVAAVSSFLAMTPCEGTDRPLSFPCDVSTLNTYFEYRENFDRVSNSVVPEGSKAHRASVRGRLTCTKRAGHQARNCLVLVGVFSPLHVHGMTEMGFCLQFGTSVNVGAFCVAGVASTSRNDSVSAGAQRTLARRKVVRADQTVRRETHRGILQSAKHEATRISATLRSDASATVESAGCAVCSDLVQAKTSLLDERYNAVRLTRDPCLEAAGRAWESFMAKPGPEFDVCFDVPAGENSLHFLKHKLADATGSVDDNIVHLSALAAQRLLDLHAASGETSQRLGVLPQPTRKGYVVRLARIDRVQCPRFHVDNVRLRTIATLVGAGTVVANEQFVNRDAFLSYRNQPSPAADAYDALLSELFHSSSPTGSVKRIQCAEPTIEAQSSSQANAAVAFAAAAPREALFLKGVRWKNDSGQWPHAVIHRSPTQAESALERHGGRLILQVDDARHQL
ncbi:Coatomer subunit gamma-2 [Porphyridium purpureum]|uniref:Coatomer subunit gamma-2 n=1 Tax=Porphyridium purpureum TaxID=35688 RepID=A0A5J4Z2N7_PORPP|nr:Coatomer subunit gamma-2 [Porphyridium purpureum]|eukprot:POR3636..scf208_2